MKLIILSSVYLRACIIITPFLLRDGSLFSLNRGMRLRVFNRDSAPLLSWRSESIARKRRSFPSSSTFFSRDFHFHSILTTVKRSEGRRSSRDDDANRLGGTIGRGGGGEGERLVLSPAASVHARVMAGNGLGEGG